LGFVQIVLSGQRGNIGVNNLCHDVSPVGDLRRSSISDEHFIEESNAGDNPAAKKLPKDVNAKRLALLKAIIVPRIFSFSYHGIVIQSPCSESMQRSRMSKNRRTDREYWGNLVSFTGAHQQPGVMQETKKHRADP
jgi:hypothetical protein